MPKSLFQQLSEYLNEIAETWRQYLVANQCPKSSF